VYNLAWWYLGSSARVLHGTSYAIPRPPVPASNSPAPLPLPPVWVPLTSRSGTFVSRSRPGPVDRANGLYYMPTIYTRLVVYSSYQKECLVHQCMFSSVLYYGGHMAGVWTLDSGEYVSLSGDWAEEMRLQSAAAAATQNASTLEHLNSPRTSAPQRRRQSCRRDAVTH